MNHDLMTVLVFLIALAILFALLLLSKLAKQKLGLEPPPSKVSAKFISLLIILFGILVGSLFSSILNEENTLMRLLYSLIIFFLIGLPELLLTRRNQNKLRAIYSLGGEIFPFFALGFSGAIFLLP